jgi:hypothetical protein
VFAPESFDSQKKTVVVMNLVGTFANPNANGGKFGYPGDPQAFGLRTKDGAVVRPFVYVYAGLSGVTGSPVTNLNIVGATSCRQSACATCASCSSARCRSSGPCASCCTTRSLQG